MYHKLQLFLLTFLLPCLGYASNNFITELDSKLSRALDGYLEKARQYKELPIYRQNSWFQPASFEQFDEIKLNLFSFYSSAEIKSQIAVIKREFPKIKINDEGTYISMQISADDARRLLIGVRRAGGDLLGLKAIDIEKKGEKFSNPNSNVYAAPYKKYSHFSFKDGIVYKYKGIHDEGIPAQGTYTGLDEFYRSQLGATFGYLDATSQETSEKMRGAGSSHILPQSESHQ